jgi:hypothetical protein
MAHYLTSDDKYRGLPYGDEDRSSLGGYQFGRTTESAFADVPH